MGEPLLQHVEKLAKKQRTDPTSKRLDEMIAALSGWLDENVEEGAAVEVNEKEKKSAPSEADQARGRSLSVLIDSLGAAQHREAFHEHHKELTSLVTKLGKAIDKVVPNNLDQALPQVHLEARLIDEAVCTHLLSVGLFDVAEALSAEAGLDGSPCMQVAMDAHQPRLSHSR